MENKRVVSWTLEDGIVTITIDNPPVNVLDARVIDQLSQVVDEVENERNVKAIILTGSGDRAFVAGGDIKGFPKWIGKGTQLAKERSLWLQNPLNQIEQLPYPTIAALNGLALGGGCELALSCDFRIAEEQVDIGLPEVKLGLFPGAGGTQRLSRLVGHSKAKEMIFTGESISAEKAKEIGLVNEVVPRKKAFEGALAFAEKMTCHSAVTIAYAKQAIQTGLEQTLAEGLVTEADQFGKVFQTGDVKEGVQAFIEKRQPNFKDI